MPYSPNISRDSIFKEKINNNWNLRNFLPTVIGQADKITFYLRGSNFLGTPCTLCHPLVPCVLYIRTDSELKVPYNFLLKSVPKVPVSICSFQPKDQLSACYW